MHHLALKLFQPGDLGPGWVAQVPFGSYDHIGIVIYHLASRQFSDFEIPMHRDKGVS